MENKDTKKLFDFFGQMRVYQYNIFRYSIQPYDLSIQKKVSEILNHSVDDDYFANIVKDKNTTNIELLAVVNNKNCPMPIKEDIVINRKLGSCYPFSFVKYFLANKVSDKTVDTLTKLYHNEVQAMLDGRGRYCDVDVSIIPDENIIKLCDAFMKRKALRRNVCSVPFVHLKDDDAAKKYLNSPKCDEVVCTAIAGNKNLSDEIRNEAYNRGVNPQMLYDYTPDIIKDIYEMTVFTYTEMEINPATYDTKKYSKQQRIPYENATGFLLELIRRNKLPESLQIDLFNRIIAMHLKKRNRILETLLRYGTSKYIIENAGLVKNAKDRLSVYLNEMMPHEEYNNGILSIINQYKDYSKSKKSIPQYVEIFLTRIAYKDDEENLRKIFSLKQESLFYHLASNNKCPEDILSKIVDYYKEKGNLESSDKQVLLSVFKNQFIHSLDLSDDTKNVLFHAFPAYLSALINNKDEIGSTMYSALINQMSELTHEQRTSVEDVLLKKLERTNGFPFEEECFNGFYTMIKNINLLIEKSNRGDFSELGEHAISSLLSKEASDVIKKVQYDPILAYNGFVENKKDRFFAMMDELNSSKLQSTYLAKQVKTFYKTNGLTSINEKTSERISEER